MIIDYLLIAAITVFVVDLSGFTGIWKRWLFRWLKGPESTYYPFQLKPFDCSLCMTFWICIIFSIFTTGLNIYNLFMITLISFLTPQIQEAIYLISDAFDYILNLLKTLLKY